MRSLDANLSIYIFILLYLSKNIYFSLEIVNGKLVKFVCRYKGKNYKK